jgi:hypothetical protein
MVATGVRFDTPDTKAAGLPEAAEAVPWGTHFCLKPLKKMLFSDYDAEVQRLCTSGMLCDRRARALDGDLACLQSMWNPTTPS